ncbi:MAG: hypothetical protein HY903_06080 [Deltaproteobacteria bacterium]|nr:hypothetical protein [Deltaproteobacteria bacterium]
MTEAQNNGRAYETEDATLRPLLLFFGGLFVLCVVVFAAMLLLFRVFERASADAERHANVHLSPLATGGRLPPEPRLQYAEPADLATHRAAQSGRATTYGWIDRSAGVVRLPVARAAALILQRGLPQPQPTTATTAPGGP